jgi:hypothetical protein
LSERLENGREYSMEGLAKRNRDDPDELRRRDLPPVTVYYARRQTMVCYAARIL